MNRKAAPELSDSGAAILWVCRDQSMLTQPSRKERYAVSPTW